MIKKKLKIASFRKKAANGFSKLKENIKSQKLKNNLKLNRKTVFISTLVVISVFGVTMVTPGLYVFAQEVIDSSKYSKVFPDFKKKKSFRDYLPFQEMLAALPGKTPSQMLGIIAAELTYQILRAVGVVVAVQVTRVAITRLPDAYFGYLSFAARMAKNKPTRDELFSESIDAVTDAF